MLDFTSLELKPGLIGNLEQLGWRSTTPIQAQALPLILDGGDVIGVAQTGSGKTGAFALGLLNRIDVSSRHVQGLVLCPTRELADQVAREIRRLAQMLPNVKVLSLCGGTPLGPQIGSLAHGAHVVVGTPGRLVKHLSKRTLRLSKVEFVVLDEADRMLDMGFEEDVLNIVGSVGVQRQTLLFSATFPPQVDALCKAVTDSATVVDVTSSETENPITEIAYQTFENERGEDVCRALAQHMPAQAIVFCNMKSSCAGVVDKLKQVGWSCAALHGDMEQRDRDLTMILFKQKSIRILVATDVAARGLDIQQLAAVFNYDLPHQADVYVHRIGRTGRAGEVGLAISLFTIKEEHRLPVGRVIEQKRLAQDKKLTRPDAPLFQTLCINGGKKDKLRPGDIVGAITASDSGIAGADIGNIHVRHHDTFVAVKTERTQAVLDIIEKDKIKGRRFKIRRQ